ncbi:MULTISPECIES: hypothetical protein [Pseudomonas syringae group]|uniref:Uncharacterized protein n=3 Tax=Pseudomonas syringae group TaxID=136849 RepID=A0AAD0GT79_9PSED|nr:MULTISPECIES: hypothetical protein [Pseudomonas syringae group]AVB22839.1 hypothetical protein BKM03_29270 [Pseudomonas avellanae]EGH14137.1 hypothetical protein PSYMP_26793 [Pseudomonas amygdali pv. morsprunorum str. M302280]KWS71687.1 hypothetical protein AL055_13095 [Pseudomonas amygdali pv. morsprunorum]PHN35708.1 hypothetical protein AO261_11910 [Pseudomonas avellanae]POC82464.1 hypothetical protein BKM26_26735 [Pseudomonas avellanae]
MYKLIRVDEATSGFFGLKMPLYSVLYSCWETERLLETAGLVELARRTLNITSSVWLNRKTCRSRLGYDVSTLRLDQVKVRCAEHLGCFDSMDTNLTVLQITSASPIFLQLQHSLKDEVDVGSEALLFLFISKNSPDSDIRTNWLRAGFLAQQLSIIAADEGFGSFTSHGYEAPEGKAGETGTIEYVLWIG